MSETIIINKQITTSGGRPLRLLWISRHPPLPKQLDELKRIFGNHELVQIPKIIKNDEEIIDLIHQYDADDLITVLPLSMIFHLVNRGIFPIWPEMEPLKDDQAFYDYKDPKSGRKYRFKNFVRIKSIKIEKTPLSR